MSSAKYIRVTPKVMTEDNKGGVGERVNARRSEGSQRGHPAEQRDEDAPRVGGLEGGRRTGEGADLPTTADSQTTKTAVVTGPVGVPSVVAESASEDEGESPEKSEARQESDDGEVGADVQQARLVWRRARRLQNDIA